MMLEQEERPFSAPSSDDEGLSDVDDQLCHGCSLPRHTISAISRNLESICHANRGNKDPSSAFGVGEEVDLSSHEGFCQLLNIFNLKAEHDIFQNEVWEVEDRVAVLAFLKQLYETHEMEPNSQIEALTQENIEDIHPLLLYKLPGTKTHLHLGAFFEYTNAKLRPYHTCASDMSDEEVVCDPYTNIPLSGAQLQDFLDYFERVIYLFKLIRRKDDVDAAIDG